MRELTEAEEIAIGDAIGEELHFCGDELAIELGIPSREEREWTDEEIDIIWAELEERMRSSLIARTLSPDSDPSRPPALG